MAKRAAAVRVRLVSSRPSRSFAAFPGRAGVEPRIRGARARRGERPCCARRFLRSRDRIGVLGIPRRASVRRASKRLSPRLRVSPRARRRRRAASSPLASRTIPSSASAWKRLSARSVTWRRWRRSVWSAPCGFRAAPPWQRFVDRRPCGRRVRRSVSKRGLASPSSVRRPATRGGARGDCRRVLPRFLEVLAAAQGHPALSKSWRRDPASEPHDSCARYCRRNARGAVSARAAQCPFTSPAALSRAHGRGMQRVVVDVRDVSRFRRMTSPRSASKVAAPVCWVAARRRSFSVSLQALLSTVFSAFLWRR